MWMQVTTVTRYNETETVKHETKAPDEPYPLFIQVQIQKEKQALVVCCVHHRRNEQVVVFYV